MPEDQKATRKLRAILSADVKGYSLLMADDEAFTIQTLKAYRKIMSELIEQHNGRVVDSPGDNILAEFRSAVDAVECAANIQRKLAKENSKFVEEKKVRFRIGVNVGDVIEDGDRIYGNGVNVAARIEGLAEPGGICISRNAYDHISDKLNYGYEYLGDHEVKNIKDPVRVYKVLMEPEDAGKLIGLEPKSSPSKWILPTVVLATIFLTVIGYQVYQKFSMPDFEPASVKDMAYQLPEKASIAVLPFRNMSEDSAKEYIADGLTENIITHMAKLPEIFVISRESSFYYKDKNILIKDVSEELGVQYVLEGSIVIVGDDIRVTAQLIDAISGHHKWSQKYDRKLENLLGLFDEITLEILKGMNVKIGVGFEGFGIGTKNINAFMKLIEGRYHYLMHTKEDNLMAQRLFESAIELDPNYAYAYVFLGWTYQYEAVNLLTNSAKESFKKAEELTRKAIAIDNSLWLSHSLLSTLFLDNHNYDQAIEESDKAITLSPGEGLAYIFHAMTLSRTGTGDSKTILALYEKGKRLNPHLPAWAKDRLAMAYYNDHSFDEAIEIWLSLLHENYYPEFVHAGLMLAYLETGMTEKAKLHADNYMNIKPKVTLFRWAAINGISSNKINKLIEPVKMILFPEPVKLNIFTYSKTPKFKFTYPATFREIDSFLNEHIIVFSTPWGNICQLWLYDVDIDQDFDNFWNTTLIHLIDRFVTDIDVVSKREIILKCGTAAYTIDYKCLYQGLNLVVKCVYAFKSNKAVVVYLDKYVDSDVDLDWILDGLNFEKQETSVRKADKPSIAVLPFDNLSNDPEQEYFSDGITDDIITDLSKISGLMVISRNTTFTYKGKEIKIPEIAKELGVQYVLEGSVRRAGNEVRINAQLIDTVTDHHLWADRFDGKNENVFDLQDKITERIVSALAIKLSASEQKVMAEKGTKNIVAYDTFLKAMNHMRKFTPKDYVKAIEYFEKAVELDPNYSEAYANLAYTYFSALEGGRKFWDEIGKDYPHCRLLSRHNVESSMRHPTSRGYQVLALLEVFIRNYEEAIDNAKLAVSLSPNDADAVETLGKVMAYTGHPEESLSYFKRAIMLDPLHKSTERIGGAYFMLEDYGQAVMWKKPLRIIQKDIATIWSLQQPMHFWEMM